MSRKNRHPYFAVVDSKEWKTRVAFWELHPEFRKPQVPQLVLAVLRRLNFLWEMLCRERSSESQPLLCKKTHHSGFEARLGPVSSLYNLRMINPMVVKGPQRGCLHPRRPHMEPCCGHMRFEAFPACKMKGPRCNKLFSVQSSQC